MTAVIFGAGNYYREQREKLRALSEVEITAFLDNNPALWNQQIDGVTVIPPDAIKTTVCEKIVIMSIYGREIYEQLTGLGIARDRIVLWERFWAEQGRENGMLPEPDLGQDSAGGDVLILSTSLNYNGGSLAAVYAARALKQRGIQVVLAAPEGNEQFVREVVSQGVTVVLDPVLPYLCEAERKWIRQFRAVVVNTLQMMECACEISRMRPVLWWIHEAPLLYQKITQRYPDSLDGNRFADIRICTVSKNARKYFNQVYPDRRPEILPFGIPDMGNTCGETKNKKVTFALIGAIYPLKGQEIFLKAADLIRRGSQAQFWVVGKTDDKAYYERIESMAAENDAVTIWGERTRKEIHQMFSEIDVIVCASYEETVSITVTEAMMYGKLCITTDRTGIAGYIQDGVNGFVVPADDVETLAERMQRIIAHCGGLQEMRTAARKTYEQYFSMETFGENLEREIGETRREWNRRQEGGKGGASVHIPDLQ